MIGCPTRHQLEQYLDERLDAPDRALVEAHVGDCRACQHVLEDAASADDADHLRGLQARRLPSTHEPKGDLLRRIEQAARSSGRPGRPKEVVIEATGAYRSPDRPLPVV